MSVRNPIVSFKDERGLMVCNQKPVRELESDFNTAIETLELMEPYLKPSIRRDLKIILKKLSGEDK